MPRRRRTRVNRTPPERNWRAVALDVMMHNVLRLRQISNQERLDALCQQQRDVIDGARAFTYHNLLYSSSHYGSVPVPQEHTHVLDPSLHASMDAYLASQQDFKRRGIFIRSMLMNALNISVEPIEVCAYLPPSFMQSLPKGLATCLTGEHNVKPERVMHFEQHNADGLQFLKEQLMINILEG